MHTDTHSRAHVYMCVCDYTRCTPKKVHSCMPVKGIYACVWYKYMYTHKLHITHNCALMHVHAGTHTCAYMLKCDKYTYQYSYQV